MILILIFCISINAYSSLPDYTHDTISRTIDTFATSIDRFFADDTALNYENKSRIRLFTDTLFTESTNQHTTGDIKVQLNFPGTEKSLQLIIESRDEDLDENDIVDRSRNKQSNKNNDTKAGFQYFLDRTDFKSSLGSGIIFRSIRPLPFIRFRIKQNITLGEWLFRPESETLWVDLDGTISKLDLDFDYKLAPKFLFRFANFTKWNDQDYIFEFSNGPSIYHKIDEKIALSYNARAISSNTPSQAIQNYNLSVGYRQLLYKKWFFWTVTPVVDFPRENNFHRTPSLNIRFEMIFGYI
jgi:hypothetical protein